MLRYVFALSVFIGAVEAIVCLPKTGTNSRKNCIWTPYFRSMSYGGSHKPSLNSLELCKADCEGSDSCKAVEWTSDNQCFHFTTADRPTNFNVDGITHYVCQSFNSPWPMNPIDFMPGPWSGFPNSLTQGDQWEEFKNKLVYGGELRPAANVEECKRTCLQQPGCKSFDWDTGRAQCFTFKTSPPNENMVEAPGVNHFVYRPSGGPKTAAKITYAQGESVYQNKMASGGVPKPVSTIEQCKDACRSQTGCRSINWYYRENKCFIIPTYIPNEALTYADGVTHYVLAHTWESDAPSNPADGWIEFPNQAISGGLPDGAKTLESCKSACNAKNGCQSIDWNTQYSQCYIFPTFDINRKTEMAFGVNHYVNQAGC